MRYLCVLNPQAGNKKAAKIKASIHTLLQEFSFETDWFISQYPHHAREIFMKYQPSDYQGIFVIGGDGTLFDIVNAQMNLPNEKRLPLAVIPAGTGNSVYMDLFGTDPQQIEKSIERVLNNKTKKIDVLQVKTSQKIFYFINILGFGFTTDVTRQAVHYKFFGKQAYTLAILKKLIGLKSYPLLMELKGKKYELHNTFVSILNTKYAGGNLLMAPKALHNDGLMDVIVVNKLSRWELLKTFPKIYDGSYIESPYVDYFQTDKIKFSSPQHKQLSPDGELCQELPVEIEVIPEALEFFI